jgi:hypothetical protein
MAVAAWLALVAAAATPSQAAVLVFWSAPDLKVETGPTVAGAAGNQTSAFSPPRSLTSSVSGRPAAGRAGA